MFELQVDDATSSTASGAVVVSRTSYNVLPSMRALSMASTTSSGAASRKDKADYLPVRTQFLAKCMRSLKCLSQVVPSSTPFQRDVRELKSIVGRIAVASRFTRQPKSCALAKVCHFQSNSN